MTEMSRRGILRTLAGGLAGAAGLANESAVGAGLSDLAEAGPKDWFDEVFSSGKAVAGSLNLYRFSDEIYAITKAINWSPNRDSSTDLKKIVVPAGFITDFASVPRILWSVLPRDGVYVFPAIVHDYMYWMQDTARDVADETLREGMQDFKVDTISINAVYWGVRAGGGSAWAANAKLKAGGERRVIRKFPESPLVSWIDWKKDPAVFE
jgi:hypothetical protein